MSKAIAHVVRYGPGEQTWYEQKEFVEKIQHHYMLKELDEEPLRAMIMR